MGLRDIWSRWTRGDDRRAVERAKEETRMTAYERDVDQEDFEARKDDVQVTRDYAGSEALDAARDDLE
jgi:hypothetical protein